MGAQGAQPSIDLVLARLFAANADVLGRDELLAAGLTARMINGRLAKGTLRRVHRGVYAPGARTLLRPSLQRAAWLAAGVASAISHFDASGSWEMLPMPSGPVAVTLPSVNGRARREGISLHRASLHPGDWALRDGIRVTSPARTLLDIAFRASRRDLQIAVDEAHHRRLISARSLAETLERNAGRRGSRELRALLEHHELGSTRTETDLEERFLAAYRRWGRFAFVTQKPIGRYRADFFFAAAACIVEVDGPIHRLESRRRRDRERDRALELLGYRTIRVTDEELDASPRAAVLRVDHDIEAG